MPASVHVSVAPTHPAHQAPEFLRRLVEIERDLIAMRREVAAAIRDYLKR